MKTNDEKDRKGGEVEQSEAAERRDGSMRTFWALTGLHSFFNNLGTLWRQRSSHTHTHKNTHTRIQFIHFHPEPFCDSSFSPLMFYHTYTHLLCHYNDWYCSTQPALMEPDTHTHTHTCVSLATAITRLLCRRACDWLSEQRLFPRSIKDKNCS